MNPQHLLDSAYRQVLAGQVIPALRLLGKPLSDLYIQNEQEDRSRELISIARAHPLFELTQQDPYTARAYNKPRGYAGDAVMLDYIYTGQTDRGISPMGTRIRHPSQSGRLARRRSPARSPTVARANVVLVKTRFTLTMKFHNAFKSHPLSKLKVKP